MVVVFAMGVISFLFSSLAWFLFSRSMMDFGVHHGVMRSLLLACTPVSVGVEIIGMIVDTFELSKMDTLQ